MTDGTYWYAERLADRVRLVTVNAHTGESESVFTISDSTLGDCDRLGSAGWVCVQSGNTLRVQLTGDQRPRILPRPLHDVWGVVGRADRLQFLTLAWNESGDSIPLDVFSLPDGRPTHWATLFGESASASWLVDGSIMMVAWESTEIGAVYLVRGPGRVERLGAIPMIGWTGFSVSRDGRRVAVTTRKYQGDVWLARVGRAR